MRWFIGWQTEGRFLSLAHFLIQGAKMYWGVEVKEAYVFVIISVNVSDLAIFFFAVSCVYMRFFPLGPR